MDLLQIADEVGRVVRDAGAMACAGFGDSQVVTNKSGGDLVTGPASIIDDVA